MKEVLQEYADSRGTTLRIDSEMGILHGVKLLGLESRNGRRYRESALDRAVPLYEGTKVNVNHSKNGPLAPRDYQDRLGVIRGVEMRTGEGLFGDLHFNPKHALAEQLAWDAEHNPQNVGFSHNVLARLSRDGEQTFVEEITQVQSVDLVADPATTRGLFEQSKEAAGQDTVEQKPSAPVAWDALTVEQLQLHRPDLLEEIESQEVEKLRRRIDELSSQAATHERRERIGQLLVEHGLPLPSASDEAASRIVNPRFLETLDQASDEDELRTLISERAELVRNIPQWQRETFRATGARSQDQLATLEKSTGEAESAEHFARSLRR